MVSYLNEKIEDIDQIAFIHLIDKADVEGELQFLQMQKVAPLQSHIEELVEKSPVRLVLFSDAVKHLNRLCRIQKMQRGHMLLVGVGGSGRRSLARLSAFLAQSTFFQLETNKKYGLRDFRQDLFKYMYEAGTKKRHIVFLIYDEAVEDERFYEDVNNLINNGEISGLIGRDELDQITVALSAEARQLKLSSPLELFNQRMRAQFHLIVSVSPVGDKLRGYFRKYFLF